MVKIYHNPRCRKSREGLALVEKSGMHFEIIRYLEHPMTRCELKEVIKLLEIKPIDLVRKQEAVWKSEYKGKNLDEDKIIDALLAHPRLMERPIVIYRGKAVVGRPPQKISDLLH